MRFLTGSASVVPCGNLLHVEIDADAGDAVDAAGQGAVLDHIGIKEAVGHFGTEDLLREMDRNEVLAFFEVKEGVAA